MRNLNTLRNNAKHHGILPDSKSNVHLSTTVYALLEEVCQTYLGLDFSSVSLKSLIINKTILGYIDQAENEIEEGKIQDGLISLAYVMFHICEASTIPWPFLYPHTQREKETSLQFIQPYKIEHTVELIAYGVDPFLYHRFKNLTPMMARHKDTGELYYWWDKHYGHPANWTARNARFCLNFCIETALKFQRGEDEGYTLIPYREVFEDIIEPVKEEAIIWNQSSHPPKFPLQEPSEPRSPVLVLKKGQPIIGWATDSENRLDEWFVTSEGIPSELTEYVGFGFVLKSEVKMTQRKRQAPKQVNDARVKKYGEAEDA